MPVTRTGKERVGTTSFPSAPHPHLLHYSSSVSILPTVLLRALSQKELPELETPSLLVKGKNTHFQQD